jgi:uncharacterized protein
MKRIGFFHNSDLDGHCSGAILKYKMPDIELVGLDYTVSKEGEFPTWPVDEVKNADEVYMVDFCLPQADMVLISILMENNGGKFVWIDHHKSAIEMFAGLDADVQGGFATKLDSGKAACELVWEYLYPGKKTPKFVKLLGKYDTWRRQDKREWEEDILPFEYGMMACDTNPVGGTRVWKDLLLTDIPILRDVAINSISVGGRHVLKYLRTRNEEIAKRDSYLVEIDGLRGIAINSESHSSMVLESVYDPNLHDIMIVYNHTHEQKWYISFYSTHNGIDCSEVAKKRGGGGHRGAAGCSVDELPFKKI